MNLDLQTLATTQQTSQGCLLSRLGSIGLNILGGLATVVALKIWDWLHRYFRHRKFRTVVGLRVKNFSLVFGRLGQPITSSATGSIASCIYEKDANRGFGITAKQVSSLCEIRGLSHVSASLNENSLIRSVVVPDEAVKEKFDLDFVSFGAMSNMKTEDIFRNAANRLGEYSVKKGAFVRKSDSSPLHNSREGFDHGIILKIHPKQFPKRTWIACAGYGEWGTSGAAYFLANHWHDIVQELTVADAPFLAVIEVEPGKDESAALCFFEQQAVGS